MKRSEALEKAITRLKEMTSEGVPVIVEGKRDRDALASLGVNQDLIYTINGPLVELVERIHSNEVIILTDCDRRGNILAGKLKRLLKNESKEAEFRIRGLLRFSGIVHIEEIPSLLLRKREKR